jgi:hypothetical protein
MKVFSVAYFSRGGSKRNSKGSSSASSSSASHNSHHGGFSRDDRPFPPNDLTSGAYIITSPPRYYDPMQQHHPQTSHTLQFARNVNHNNHVFRGSNPDLRRLNGSGYTIYDDEDFNPGGNRRRHGSSSSNPTRSIKNPFQRSRSTSASGRKGNGGNHNHNHGNHENNGFVWPTQFIPAGAFASPAMTPTSSQNGYGTGEPIYSEPLPPMTSQVREAERKTMLKQSSGYYPNPHDPVQISNHIYEYLVTRRSDASSTQLVNGSSEKAANAGCTGAVPKGKPSAGRRGGSLASSPSSTASSSSKRDSQDSNSGRNTKKMKFIKYRRGMFDLCHRGCEMSQFKRV